MPKVSIKEDEQTAFADDNIGASGKPVGMSEELDTTILKFREHHSLDAGVFPPNAGH